MYINMETMRTEVRGNSLYYMRNSVFRNGNIKHTYIQTNIRINNIYWKKEYRLSRPKDIEWIFVCLQIALPFPLMIS